MVDSDVDSWYDWRQGDDFNEMRREKGTGARNDVRLRGSDRFDRLTSDDSQKGRSRRNGLTGYSMTPTSSKSGPEVRFINPAIYAETLNNEDEEHEVEIRVKVSSKDNGQQFEGNHGDFTEVNDIMSTLSIKNDLSTSFVSHAGDQASAQETYRCYSMNSPPTPASLESDIVRSKSVVSCRPSNRVERRCRIAGRADDNDELCSARKLDSEVQRYKLNGHRVVQVSTASLTSISISENRSNESELAKKITYSEWMRKKQESERRRKEEEDMVEERKRMEAERVVREKEVRETRERENFLKWTERKKKEEEKRKAVVEKELELQKQLKVVEDKASVVKNLYLRQWARKKDEKEKGKESGLRFVQDVISSIFV